MIAMKTLRILKMAAFLLLLATAIVAFATTIPAGKGTLSYTRNEQYLFCDPLDPPLGRYLQNTVNNISYTDPTNGTTKFPNAEMSYILDSSQSGPCPDNGPLPQSLLLVTPSGDQITFSTTGGVIFTATVKYP